MSKIDLLLADPRFTALDDAGKKAALDRYFNKYVPQDSRYQALDEEGKQATHKKFMDKYYGVTEPEQPKQRTLKEMMSPDATGAPSLGAQPAQPASTNVAAVENYMAKEYKGDAQKGYEMGKLEAAKQDKPKNILEAMDVGFTTGLTRILSAPETISSLIQGDNYTAQHIQGMVDQQLSQAGYDDMDMGKAIAEGDLKKAGGMALRTFAQSAPVTALWLINNWIGDIGTGLSTGAAKYAQLDRDMPEAIHRHEVCLCRQCRILGSCIRGNR